MEKSSRPVVNRNIIDPIRSSEHSPALSERLMETNPPTTEVPRVYLTGFKLHSVVVGLISTIFLVTLNGSIVSTAIPSITSQFHSVADIGWYGSAYLICT